MVNIKWNMSVWWHCKILGIFLRNIQYIESSWIEIQLKFNRLWLDLNLQTHECDT